MNAKALKLENIFKSFGDVKVLKDINLEINEGEFVVFVGPSGCGKSTLLRIISGLEVPTEGDIIIREKLVNNIPASERDLSMVFQSYALYPHMSVKKNLSFGLENLRIDKSEIEERIKSAAKLLRIEELMARRPGQLSGGQRQRVAIGRSIVRKPIIFLFDEPLSNLDAELRMQMRVELSDLHEELGNTMIYVTHDQIEAMTMADRIVVMRDGVIEQIGTPLELYNYPTNKFVAGFIGAPQMNFINAKKMPDGLTIVNNHFIKSVYNNDNQNSELILGIRPEHIDVSLEGEGDLKAIIDNFEQLGSVTYIYLKLESNESLTVQLPYQVSLKRNQKIAVSFDNEKIHIFDGETEKILNSKNLERFQKIWSCPYWIRYGQ